MMIPQFRGSDTVFDHFLMPLLNDHEDTIDSGIEEYKAVSSLSLAHACVIHSLVFSTFRLT